MKPLHIIEIFFSYLFLEILTITLHLNVWSKEGFKNERLLTAFSSGSQLVLNCLVHG